MRAPGLKVLNEISCCTIYVTMVHGIGLGSLGAAREELLGSYHRVEWCVADNTLALADGARANESFRIRNAMAMRRAHEMFSAKFMNAASTLF